MLLWCHSLTSCMQMIFFEIPLRVSIKKVTKGSGREKRFWLYLSSSSRLLYTPFHLHHFITSWAWWVKATNFYFLLSSFSCSDENVCTRRNFMTWAIYNPKHRRISISCHQLLALAFFYDFFKNTFFVAAAVSLKNAREDKKNSKPCIMRIYFCRVKILSTKSLSWMNIFRTAARDFTLLCGCFFHSLWFSTHAWVMWPSEKNTLRALE